MNYHMCSIRELSVDLCEVYRAMGYSDEPDKEIEAFTRQVLEEVSLFCQPQYLYEIYDGYVPDKTGVSIHNMYFRTGRIINSYLSGADHFCVFVATAGDTFDQYTKKVRAEGDLLKEFVLDSLGSVIAEACVSKIADELSQSTELEQTYPYSPGYCGWKLTEQKGLFSLLPESPCGIGLTESCLMLPIKSISGIIALGKEVKRKAYSCAICNHINCYKRKKIV